MTLRRSRPWTGWCLLLATLFAACSSSNEGSGGGGSGGSGGSGGKTGGAAGGGGVAGSQVVGTSGGTVTQNGVTLTIPANAVPANVAITVAPTTAPAGYALASEAFQFGPSGTTFAQPVTVKLPLTSATTGAHLFWSNASGGFDDLGGTINGMVLTGSVSHFSVGFCARPSTDGGAADGGAGGTSGSAGAGGAAGDGSAGAGGRAGTNGAAGTGGTAGTSGAAGINGGAGTGGHAGSGGAGTTGGSAGTTGGGAGTTGGGAGTTGGGAGTTGGGAGTTGGSAGTTGQHDAGSGDAAASLCATTPLNLPGVKVSEVDAGTPPDVSTYTGGAITSGKYYLTADTHYGAGTYTGPIQAQYTIDATAQTIQIGERTGGGTYYIGITYTNPSANLLAGTVVCNTSPTNMTTLDLYYTFSGSTLTLFQAGSSDVSTIGGP
jgi:ZU5 domain